MVLLICYFYFIYIYAKYIDRGVGFRSHLMVDAGWSEQRRPTTKVLEQRASGRANGRRVGDCEASLLA